MTKSSDTLRDLQAAFADSDRRHPTPLTQELYDRAEAEGFDMKGYVVPYRSKITGLMCYDDENGYTHGWDR